MSVRPPAVWPKRGEELLSDTLIPRGKHEFNPLTLDVDVYVRQYAAPSHGMDSPLFRVSQIPGPAPVSN